MSTVTAVLVTPMQEFMAKNGNIEKETPGRIHTRWTRKQMSK